MKKDDFVNGRRAITALWGGLCIATIAGVSLHIANLCYPASRAVELWTNNSQLLQIAAYIVVLVLCLRIRNDYRPRCAMRLAWSLIAVSSAVAIVRYAFEWSSVVLGWTSTRLTTLVSLRQIPIVISLLLLTAGLIAMWSSFAAIGLGLRFRPIDGAVALGILVLVPWIFSLRAGMNDARSVYPAMRMLQSASPMLLAAPALVGLALHRISREMGGGQMAVSLRCLVAFLLLRLAALLAGLSPVLLGQPVVAALIQRSGVLVASWLFALAVAYRWQLTVSAETLSRRYEVNPEAELALLCRSLDQSGQLIHKY